MNPQQPTKLKTLGPVSASFIQKLYNEGKTLFTLDEAVEFAEKSRKQTSTFIRQLIERGVIARIRSGVYVILQMGQESVQLTNWPIIARELVGSNRYYISHYSAMRLHGMTTHPSLEVTITVTKRMREKVLNGVKYHFVYSKEEHFWGEKSHWASKQEKVIVSDIERTILDGLDRPEFSGGIKEVVRSIWSAKDKIDFDKLMHYALQYRNKAAIKRLGFILELLAIAANFTPILSKMITDKKDYILLDPTGIKEGKHLKRWRVQVNINIDELKESIWA